MTRPPGMGVMINALGGDDGTGGAVQVCLGKRIRAIGMEGHSLDKQFGGEDAEVLVLTFDDGTFLRLWDNGQSCCESRYMTTDDVMSNYVGGNLVNVEVRDGPEQEGEYGEVHESQFLVVTTSLGSFTVTNHNEHNGYYGGFWVKAEVGGAA